VVVRTVPITRGTSRPASASNAATKKKKNPEPPPAPPPTRGTEESGDKGAAGATSGLTAGTRACTPARPPGPLIGLCVRPGALPRAIVPPRAAASLTQLMAGVEPDGMRTGTALPGRADRAVPGAATGAVEPMAAAAEM
jgi:hypothetical protein